MKQPEIGDLVKNRLFRNGVQPRIGVVVDGAFEWVDGELVDNKEWFVSWDTGEVSTWAARHLKIVNDPSE
jgi:hypothetical protein